MQSIRGGQNQRVDFHCGESGINFFNHNNNADEQNSFEVNVDAHLDYKNDLLQIIHLQAAQIEMEYLEREGMGA